MAGQPEGFLEHFRQFSEKQGFAFPPPKAMIDWMVNYGHRSKKEALALQFAAMNHRLYPNSKHAGEKLRQIQSQD